MLIKHQDQMELVPVSQFPFAKFSYDHFNCVQSRVFEFYKENQNTLVASSTASGKTTVAEMYISHEVRERKGRAIFLGPLKALMQEKIDDWTDENHHFSDLKVSICTGDYKFSNDRKDELENADILVMTSEMLNSKARSAKSDSSFISNVGTLVIDEVHTITYSGRGSHLESGIIKFLEVNPDARIVVLSATMPNVEEIAEWLSNLNKKKTNVLISNYRPCPLHKWHVSYDDSMWKYEEKEKEKVYRAIDLMRDHPEDKFLLFVHSKATGLLLKETLDSYKINCEFHNASLDKNKRVKLEKRFREDPDFKALVATSTLAAGINCPARRVIIVGVHRGLTEIPTYEIMQMCGRAGRPKYDPRGDAYILLPDSEFNEQKERLQKCERIVSQMCNPDAVAFHVVNEIYQENIQTKQGIFEWHSKTLAAHQDNGLDSQNVENILKNLKKCGAIFEEETEYKATSIGKISSLFYYSPFDVSDLRNNFDILFNSHKEIDDYWASIALANIYSNRSPIVSKAERAEMLPYMTKILKSPINGAFARNGFALNEGVLKAGFCYYSLLNGSTAYTMANLMNQYKLDYQRLHEVVNAIDSMVGKWNKKDYFYKLNSRILYGVSWDLLELVRIPDIGKVKAKKLWGAGIKTIKDFINNPNTVGVALGCNSDKAFKYIEGAKSLL